MKLCRTARCASHRSGAGKPVIGRRFQLQHHRNIDDVEVLKAGTGWQASPAAGARTTESTRTAAQAPAFGRAG